MTKEILAAMRRNYKAQAEIADRINFALELSWIEKLGDSKIPDAVLDEIDKLARRVKVAFAALDGGATALETAQHFAQFTA